MFSTQRAKSKVRSSRVRHLVIWAGSFSILGLSCRQAPSIAREPQFSRTGATPVARIASNCMQVSDFVFSPNGARVVYAGWINDESRLAAGVWMNDSLLARADSVFEIGFTRKNEPYFIASDSGRAFIYYRYARPRAYERLFSPQFSNDGARMAYLTENGANRNLLVSNAETNVVTDVLDYALNPVDDLAAYAVRDSQYWTVIEDSDVSDIYDWVQGMTYSEDGTSLAYAAMADDEWFLVHDGEELDPLDELTVDVTDVVLSRDGSHYACAVAAVDDEVGDVYQYVLKDGEEGDGHDDISGLCLSADGQRLAYVVDDGAGQFVVEDDQENPAYDEVWGLAFSPSGSRLAYVARDGDEEFAVLEETEYPSCDQIDRVRFSRAGDRIGYGALLDDEFVWVVDEVR